MRHSQRLRVRTQDWIQAHRLGKGHDASVAGGCRGEAFGEGGGADWLGDGAGLDWGDVVVGGQDVGEPVVDAARGGVDGGVGAVCGCIRLL